MTNVSNALIWNVKDEDVQSISYRDKARWVVPPVVAEALSVGPPRLLALMRNICETLSC